VTPVPDNLTVLSGGDTQAENSGELLDVRLGRPGRKVKLKGPVDAGSEKENILMARQLRVRLPTGTWTREISRRHPDTIFEITNWMEWTKERTIADVQIYHPGTWDSLTELRAMDGVFQVESLATVGSVQRFCVVYETPVYYPLFKRFGVMQKTPFRMHDGVSTWEVVGTGGSIRRMIVALRKQSIGVVLDPLSRNVEESGLVFDGGGRPKVVVPLPIDRTGLGHLAICRLRLSLPPPYWHPKLSKSHPESSIDVMGYSLTDEGMFADVRAHTLDMGAWIEALHAYADIYDVKPLGRAHRATTARVYYERNKFITALCRLHLILRTPFTIRDGVAEVTMAGPKVSIKRFIEMFPALHIQVEATYDSEREEETLLTPHQSAMFRMALAAGYYEVPRHVTLTELAVRAGITTSSLSEMLAVIEKKVLHGSQAANA